MGIDGVYDGVGNLRLGESGNVYLANDGELDVAVGIYEVIVRGHFKAGLVVVAVLALESQNLAVGIYVAALVEGGDCGHVG